MEKEIETVSASDVAKYLLDKKGSLTGFQLQKLFYYCQAWSLAVDKTPLFEDEIRAYEHGPVVQSVSMQHQHSLTVYPAMISGDSSLLPTNKAALVDKVLEAYDILSGDDLEKLSHEEAPWKDYFNGHSGSRSAIIPEEAMFNYYAQLLASDSERRARHHVPRFDHPKKSASRILVIDALNADLIPWYEKRGFKKLPASELRMVCRMSKIASFCNNAPKGYFVI